jgi:hypothetical protein
MANSPGRRRCVDRVGSLEANMLPGEDEVSVYVVILETGKRAKACVPRAWRLTAR